MLLKNAPERKRQKRIAALSRMELALEKRTGIARTDPERLEADIERLASLIPADSQRGVRTKKKRAGAWKAS